MKLNEVTSHLSELSEDVGQLNKLVTRYSFHQHFVLIFKTTNYMQEDLKHIITFREPNI